MSKHISDQPRSHGSARLREFLKQERAARRHPAIAALRSRSQVRNTENRKTVRFLRIERGRTV